MASQSSSPGKPSTPRRRPLRRLWRWLLLSILPLSIAAVVGLLILTVVSYRVAARFEARELESPTRLLARTARLDDGVFLPAEEIVARLRRLGYRQTKGAPKSPGEFRAGETLDIRMRAFEGPQGPVPARSVRIGHRKQRIHSVRDLDAGSAIPGGVLLEPEVLTTLYGSMHEDRTVLPLDQFPPRLIDAVLVVEDRHFYAHPGIDPTGMLRAMVANVRSGEIRQGGSTVTQQLAKNLFFDQRRTWTRKLSEAVVAVILEARYPKERLLQAYLNEVYLGQRGSVSVRGFAQAAGFYFGKDVRFLDLSESAALAGMIRSPGQYNPFMRRSRCMERRDQVLAAMEEEGKITSAERRAAQAASLKVRKASETTPLSRGVSFLADHVRQELAHEAGEDFTRAGMRIFTTVDPTLQRRAEEALGRGLEQLERGHRKLRRSEPARKLQGGIVAIDPRDGSVLAMVGGRDYGTSQFNHITQARRQPGSLFKPFVYLAGYEAALSAGWGDTPFTPATQLEDSPLERREGGKLWAPANYDNEFRGPVTAQASLEQSLNVPTVRAAEQIGLDAVIEAARLAGITAKLKPYASLALGAQEVTPLEIASAYATIANGGVHNQPTLIDAVRDGRGEVSGRTARPHKVIAPQAAFLVTTALQGALDHGTAASARQLGFTGTAAGKTGTTDDYRDAWFAGYTPDLLALVWVGFDDGASTGLTGAQAALPIWVDFIKKAGAETSEPFEEPPGIVWEKIDPQTGGLARWACDDSRWMAFLEGAQPEEKCSAHGWFGGWWSRREPVNRPIE
ncbi:MAG TPA: PBP1A family penicillin-binding protein [Candidatus Polarisedimenticolia bacterium]|nr:PBP1A family penicillin-binding protein [Candidatus Polarisedimenticolia bacterium]